MSNSTGAWRYFAIHSGAHVHSIVRCPVNDLSVTDQNPTDVQAYVGNGLWKFKETIHTRMMEDYLTGWFDEEDDQIQEEDLDSAIQKLKP